MTDKAYGISTDDGMEWVPKSQMEDEPEVGDSIGGFYISEWFAEQRGWEYEQ